MTSKTNLKKIEQNDKYMQVDIIVVLGKQVK